MIVLRLPTRNYFRSFPLGPAFGAFPLGPAAGTFPLGLVLSGFESGGYIPVECQLAEGFGRVCFKWGFGSVNG